MHYLRSPPTFAEVDKVGTVKGQVAEAKPQAAPSITMNANAMFVDALSNGQNSVLMVTTEQLKAMVDYCMKVAKEEAEKESLAEREELRPVEYWLEKLHTTRTTLWRWEKKGLIKPTRMCGKVFYKMSDFNLMKEGRL